MISGVFAIDFGQPGGASRRRPLGLSTGARPFLAGPENRLVDVALRQLAQPEPFSPCVWLYGPTGVGKTHLALGLVEAWRSRPAETAQYLAAADFARGYADACDTDSVADWRRHCGSFGLLAIDNLEELADKPAAQQELASLLDRRAQCGGRLLVVSRTLGGAHAPWQPMLVSRLSSGLAAAVATPAAAARRELLAALADEHRLSLADEDLARLAERLTGSAPQLRGVIVELAQRVNADGTLPRDAIDRRLAAELAIRTPSMSALANAVARRLQLRTSELRGPSRRRAIVRARGLAIWLARRLTPLSYEQIGKYFGGRDHTTVLHASRQAAAWLADDPQLQRIVAELEVQWS